MYCISEQQQEFILNDIRARGIELVSLQQDLLDHVCCIIEQNLEEDGNFESFYLTCIEQFYNQKLSEIEEETINLLIHKNYYIMKKGMLISGTVSTLFLSLGIAFKFLHFPGAAVLILLGVLLLSFLFLPLLFVLKVKESKESKDKVILGVGFLASISLTLGTLFKVMHWPFANMLGLGALLIMLCIFLPIYFISGIKNPATKVNTIVSSLLLVIGCSLMLMLVRSPNGTRKLYLQKTNLFYTDEQILKNEQPSAQFIMGSKEKELFDACESLKKKLLKKDTGVEVLDAAYDEKNTLLSEASVSDYLDHAELMALKEKAVQYNLSLAPGKQKIFAIDSFLEEKDLKIDTALHHLFQLQMFILQNL